jgi:hypothetical protein
MIVSGMSLLTHTHKPSSKCSRLCFSTCRAFCGETASRPVCSVSRHYTPAPSLFSKVTRAHSRVVEWWSLVQYTECLNKAGGNCMCITASHPHNTPMLATTVPEPCSLGWTICLNTLSLCRPRIPVPSSPLDPSAITSNNQQSHYHNRHARQIRN